MLLSLYRYLVRRKGQQTCCSFFTVHLLLANLLRPDSFHADIFMKEICSDSCSFFVIICLRTKKAIVEIVRKLRMRPRWIFSKLDGLLPDMWRCTPVFHSLLFLSIIH